MQKTYVQIGAGKIGRGYIADLFNAAGYHLVFLDVVEPFVKALREQGYYTLFKSNRNTGEIRKEIIRDYEVYCTATERETAVEKIEAADAVSVNVYPVAVPDVSALIAEVIKLRVSKDKDKPLDIMVGVNFLRSSTIFRNKIREFLDTDEEKEFLENKLGLMECIVGRMGAIPTKEMLEEDKLACYSNDVPFITVDDSYKGTPPDMEAIVLKKNVPLWMFHKIWVGNMSHSLGGYLGKLKGYDYIGECRDDPEIAKALVFAQQEGKYAMNRELGLSYEEMEPEGYLENQKKGYLNHAVNSSEKDTINRVCADLIRKLGKEDRLVGPALGCMKNGRVPYFLAKGIASALRFFNEADKTTIEVRDYIAENGVEKTIEKYCGLSDDVPAEKALKQLVVGIYYDITDVYPFDVKY